MRSDGDTMMPPPTTRRPPLLAASLSSALLLLSLSASPSPSVFVAADLPAYVGPRDRFWRHHALHRTLIVDGVELYDTIESCLHDGLTESDRDGLSVVPTNRTIGRRLLEDKDDFFGNIILVEIENAMTPAHVRAVQTLASCIRAHIPSLHERRPMYKEFNFNKDASKKHEEIAYKLGGNNPTHMVPLLGVFLPQVVEDMMRVIEMAYEAAAWNQITLREEIMWSKEFNSWGTGGADRNTDEKPAVETSQRGFMHPHPRDLGFRASEHLTYTDFPTLDGHLDGSATAYTVNYAFSGPDDYEGGYLYLHHTRDECPGDSGLDGKPDEYSDLDCQRYYFKPPKFGCVVFLGGLYKHGVTEITGGHREMFSTETWYNPDIPLGSTLWTSTPENMEDYIERCNELGHVVGEGPCEAEFSNQRVYSNEFQEEEEEEDSSDDEEEDSADSEDSEDSEDDSEDDEDEVSRWSKGSEEDSSDDEEEEEDSSDDEEEEVSRWNKLGNEAHAYLWEDYEETQPYWTEDERYAPMTHVDGYYMSETEQPNFLVPSKLEPGEIQPLYFRHSRERIKDDEAFAVGLPPELLTEFQKYMDRNGMLDLAKRILYKEELFGNDDHRIYTLNDGQTWGAMGPRWDGMDMIWIDPGDEECYESLVDVLRRGNFDVVLDAIGRQFDLDSLMIQGIGPIFLSHFDHDPSYSQMHKDLPGAKGAFYNVIVPLHIPEGGAPLYVGDEEQGRTIEMAYNVGTLAGAETLHGTGECDYRPDGDVRLSVAIYVADVTDDNIELIASDSTSLWPTEGDIDWFRGQAGRVWSRDGTRSLRKDGGRKPLNVQDERQDCPRLSDRCVTDPTGVRLECPKTCCVYLEDEAYYEMLASMVEGSPTGSPACSSTDEASIAKEQM